MRLQTEEEGDTQQGAPSLGFAACQPSFLPAYETPQSGAAISQRQQHRSPHHQQLYKAPVPVRDTRDTAAANLREASVQQLTLLAQHRYPPWRMQACYSQHLFNATLYDAIATAIITLQAFAGMWINAFIVSVLCIAWVKKKSFNSNEKILLFLGCVRFWYLCITGLYFVLSTFYARCFYVYPIPQIFVTIQSFLNSSNLWVSACLCVFYCIKIANFRHRFFIYLKVKIDRIVPRLLEGFVLLSLVFCIFVYDITAKAYNDNFNSTSLGNFWRQDIRIDKYFFPVFFLTGFVYAIAFTAVISSALLLLFSLWRHQRKMQTNSVKNLSTDAHVKAMKSILLSILIFTSVLWRSKSEGATAKPPLQIT
nr:PREDICTED: taste receptor type 2 member 9-like [Opisthocomus hoazin]